MKETIIICDRCKHSMGSKLDPTPPKYELYLEQNHKKLDLCAKCMDQLVGWMDYFSFPEDLKEVDDGK